MGVWVGGWGGEGDTGGPRGGEPGVPGVRGHVWDPPDGIHTLYMCVCVCVCVCVFRGWMRRTASPPTRARVCVCVQHDVMFPVLLQRVQHVDLRYVQDDGQESRPHVLIAAAFDNYPTAMQIEKLDFAGLQANNVVFYVATYADLRGILS